MAASLISPNLVRFEFTHATMSGQYRTARSEHHRVMSGSHSETDFRCDYCADDQSRFFGHVTQLAAPWVGR